ncbi:unnamed protein product [Acanthoscelides obtectus]|uniref:Uncharacterized protein n=1 Tax=Acanthoscelides obtectus TaxID=200917 RepID=A0A9P0Q7A8_ACAOB|nr:unnamed protein product [Acanthoscelides obtectus]CAK1631999.1 hypothetical protein AOBTE_LOCUS7293 [Acanthoscelides obtectus]
MSKMKTTVILIQIPNSFTVIMRAFRTRMDRDCKRLSTEEDETSNGVSTENYFYEKKKNRFKWFAWTVQNEKIAWADLLHVSISLSCKFIIVVSIVFYVFNEFYMKSTRQVHFSLC